MTEKTCIRCLAPKPPDQFPTGKNTCRACRNEQHRIRLDLAQEAERREAESMLNKFIHWPLPGRVLR